MRRTLMTAAVALATAFGATAAHADHPQGASYEDLRSLRYELTNLDESLANIEMGDPRYSGLQQRVDWLREDVKRLESQIRSHQRTSEDDWGASRDDVERLRRQASALQDEIDKVSGSGRTSAASVDAGAPSGRYEDVLVPQGTEVHIELDQPLSSATARRDERVVARVAEPVAAGGRVVVPAGARVEGIVRDVETAGRGNQGGQLELAFERVVLDDGRSAPLEARVVSVGEDGLNRRSAERAGIGAIIGGVLGTVVGGRRGAVLGAVLGGAGVLVATEGRELELPAGSVLTLRLDGPLGRFQSGR